MKKIVLILITLIFLCGVSVIGDEISTRFHKDIAGFFKTDLETVTAISKSGIVDDELAVLFFVAQTTKTSPDKIAKFRLRKESWSEINSVRGASPTDFYMLIMAEVTSKVYAPIFQKYKDTPEEQWKKISFSDEEIINLVNLKVISKHHGFSVFEVMAMRDMGKGFARINNDIAELKLAMMKKEKEEKKKKKAEQSTKSGE